MERLIRRFSSDVLARALSDWAWLPDLDGKVPLLTSAFGDVFLQGADGIWFLDIVEGTLVRQWDGPQALQSTLNTPDGQSQFLLAGLVVAAHQAGLEPADSEVLSFKIPPALGGELDPANVEVSDLSVALAVAGQIHQQIKDLPPGTAIAGVDLT